MPLDPEIAAYLEQHRNDPPRASLTIEQTRAMMRSAATPGPPLRTEDLEIAGRPARCYGNPDRTVVVFFHGGRFFSGNLESHDGLCRWLAAESGRTVLAVDYRLAPEHKFTAAYDDACAAAAWAVAQFDRVAVAGDSAGANLAAGAALAVPDVCAQLLVYPMIDATCGFPSHVEFASGYGPGSEDMRRGWELYAGGADPRDPRLSPLFAGTNGAPPALVITAEYDSLRDEGEEFARKLPQCTLHRYDGTIHGFYAAPGRFEVARRAVAESASWLRANL